MRLAVSRRRLAATGLAALALAGGGHAIATAAPDPTPPPGILKLPGATVRITPTQISQGTRDEVTFSVEIAQRRLARGTLELTLPRPWLDASIADGKPVAGVPRFGSGPRPRVTVRRSDRVVRFTFTNARRGDTGRFTVVDRTLAPGTYRPRFALRTGGRYASATATGAVVVLSLPSQQLPTP